MSTERIELASRFVNHTHQHIFLTGKAGTGKTTFLRELRKRTHKSFIVVAPTGIAALNAAGVTIHSQFLFPLGSFIPGGQADLPGGPFFNRHHLARKHALNQARKKVLRSIDLLVIDEVSMLRADLLDAIDSRLRSARGRYREPFGGVQLLLIGDLFQLPPVVKEEEWRVLSRYYPTPHFFSSKGLTESGLVYLELDKIFRQQDDAFIGLLNNLRHNKMTSADAELLNRYYEPDRPLDAEEEIITLTTHNYRADQINQSALDQLSGDTHIYEAQVEGDFPTSMYPVQAQLILKEGAQVMFIKNDSSGAGLYFNGKLATVIHLDEEEIIVRLADSHDELTLHRERWENKRYTLDPDKQELEEKVIGAFEHYPIKLAWAITVHKSQGLTFDKAIIDVGKAFAPGQVYVALSRLRSLDGLVLRTPIDPDTLSSDDQIVSFSEAGAQQPPLKEQLSAHQWGYLRQLCERSFSFGRITRLLADQQKGEETQMEFDDPEVQQALPRLMDRYAAEEKNTRIFRQQLAYLIHQQEGTKLMERIRKGSAYYTSFLIENIRQLLRHWAAVSQLKRTKTYQQVLEEIDQLQTQQLDSIEKLTYIVQGMLEDRDTRLPEDWEEKRKERREKWMEEDWSDKRPSQATRKSGRKRKKGETYQLTYKMLREGKTIREVAEERSLAITTIYGHVARGIKSGDITIEEALPADSVRKLLDAVKPHADKGHKDIHEALEGSLSYHEIRVATAYFEAQKQVSKAAD